MDSDKISPAAVEKLRDQLNILTSLLHQVLEKPILSKDLHFLHEAQKTICSLNELSKL